MKLILFLVCTLSGVMSFARFDSCRLYFSLNYQNGKNLVLSERMQVLQLDMSDILSAIRSAKVGHLDEASYTQVLNENVLRFLRIAQDMHEQHAGLLAPGHIYKVEVDRRESYLKMYSSYTEKFLILAKNLMQSYQDRDWINADQWISKILTLTNAAHKSVDSQSGY